LIVGLAKVDGGLAVAETCYPLLSASLGKAIVIVLTVPVTSTTISKRYVRNLPSPSG